MNALTAGEHRTLVDLLVRLGDAFEKQETP
jgi:hypothetical protein